MLNRVVIMGRLTRDPELRHTQSGTSVASFCLAVDRDFKDKATGEKATDFIDIVAWRSSAEFVSRYFTKGRMAVVNGRLQTRTWKDKDGNNRKAVEVVADGIYFGDSKRDEAPSAPADENSYLPPPIDRPTGTEPPPGQAGFDGYEGDGELPF